MNTVTLKSISLATAFSASGIAHSGTVLDFESLEVEDNSIHGHGDFYTEDGFNLTETSVSSFGFGSFGTLESRYPGSTSLFSNTPGGTVTLVKADSGSFSLDAIDLVKLDPFNSISFSGDVNVTFNATLTGGGAASQTFTINSPQVTTFIFNSSFNSVTSVSWIQAAPFHQFDNITIDGGLIASVPTPSGAALGAPACVACVFRRRRNRKA